MTFFISGSANTIVMDTSSVVAALVSAGFPISGKSHLSPVDFLCFLGIDICSSSRSPNVPEAGLGIKSLKAIISIHDIPSPV